MNKEWGELQPSKQERSKADGTQRVIIEETEPPSDDRRKPIAVHSGPKTPGVMEPLEGEEGETSGPSDVKGNRSPTLKEK